MISTALPARPRKWASFDQGFLVACLTGLLAVVLAVSVSGFASWGNLVNILVAAAGLGILAIGQGLVVMARGLDLSIVATYGVTAQLVATLIQGGAGVWTAIVVGLVVATVMGLVNGLLVAYVDIPAFFVTLATSLLFLGAFRLFLFEGSLIFVFPESASVITTLGHGSLLGIPVSVIVWLGLAAAVWWATSRTAAGRMIFACGDNPAAASLVGMPARPLTTLTYVASAVLAFVAGLIIAGAAGNFDTRIVSAGSQLYDVLAIVVIGGVSLAGGRGSIGGIVAATLFIGVVLNGMTLLNLSDVQSSVTKSVIVLAALVLDRFLHPPNEETARAGEL